MGTIKVTDIRLYAYHGCMKEEGIVGGNYRVDVWVKSDTAQAERTDQLEETVDYAAIYEIVKEEMSIRSKLLEHVGRRIADSVKARYPSVISGEVSVAKLNPPIPGTIGEVTVVVSI